MKKDLIDQNKQEQSEKLAAMNRLRKSLTNFYKSLPMDELQQANCVAKAIFTLTSECKKLE